MRGWGRVAMLFEHVEEVLGCAGALDNSGPVVNDDVRDAEDGERLLELVAVTYSERLALERLGSGFGEPLPLVRADRVIS